MPNPFLIATRKGSARLHNTLCGLRQQFCFICTVLGRFDFSFFNDIRELQTPKESSKVRSESETVPQEREWPFRPSSLKKLSQRLAEKAHLLTKTRERQERTFSNTRSSLPGTGDDYPNQPSVCRVTEITISALEGNWCLSWCKEKRNCLRSGWVLPWCLAPAPMAFPGESCTSARILASPGLAPSSRPLSTIHHPSLGKLLAAN